MKTFREILNETAKNEGFELSTSFVNYLDSDTLIIVECAAIEFASQKEQKSDNTEGSRDMITNQMSKQIKHYFTVEKAQSGKYKIVDDDGNEYKFIAYVKELNQDSQVLLLDLINKEINDCSIDGKLLTGDDEPYFHLIEEVEKHTYWVGVFANDIGAFFSTTPYKDKKACRYVDNINYTLIHETTFEA